MDPLNRAKFLELAADSVAADSLYLVPEDGGGSRLDVLRIVETLENTLKPTEKNIINYLQALGKILDNIILFYISQSEF